MADPLATYRRSGFPKENLTEAAYQNIIEYIGPRTSLTGQVTAIGEPWGDYPGFISSADYEDLEFTNPLHGILRIVVETKQGSADYPSKPTGELDETNDEEDWAVVQRSMWEHPQFRVGGGGASQLSSGDVEEIKAWINEEDVDKKAAYEYKPKGLQDGAAYYRTLSDNAILFAKGIQQGVEYYNDYAPVVRRSSTYIGGPPPDGNAGQKQDPPAGLGPAGYEWIKNAYRKLKSGGQTKWRLDEEWIGAIKVLVDRDEIFWG